MPSRRPGGNPFPGLLQLPDAALRPWLMGPLPPATMGTRFSCCHLSGSLSRLLLPLLRTPGVTLGTPG